MSEKSTIRVIDNLENKLLKEFSWQEKEKAFQYAAQMESYGLEVSVITPTIMESLGNSLGITPDQAEDLRQSVIAEMEDHDGSCCHGPNEVSKKD